MKVFPKKDITIPTFPMNKFVAAVALIAFVATSTPMPGFALAPPNATDPDDFPKLHEQARDQFKGKYHLEPNQVLCVWPGLPKPIIGSPREVIRRIARACGLDDVTKFLISERTEGALLLKAGQRAVTGPQLSEKFTGTGTELIEKVRKAFKLPNVKKFPENKVTLDKGSDTVTFFKVLVGRRRFLAWAYDDTDRNNKRIARRAGLRFKQDLPQLGAAEIGVTGPGLDKAFVGGPAVVLKKFKDAYKLPDVNECKENEITRGKGESRTTFFKRQGGRRVPVIWAFDETDKEKAAKAAVLGLRVDPEIEIEQLGLTEAIALLGNDPLRLQQYIKICHPELLPDEVDRVVVSSLKSLRAELPDEEELHADYKKILPKPKIENPPKKTDAASFLLKGSVRKGIPYVQVTGAYTRKITVHKDGTFSANIPLPRIGEKNEFSLYAFDPKKKQKSRNSVSFTIKQTGTKEDAEEVFLKLLSLKEELLDAIKKDEARYGFLLRCVEISLLKRFTYKESDGFRYLTEKIEQEKSPAKKAILEAVLKKFRTIRKMEFELKPDERLYFFQKYCIYEVRSLMQKGAKGIIIANEQGLGKTLTALVIVADKQAVIITPNAVVTTWGEQEAQFMPQAKLAVLDGTYAERDEALAQLTRPHVVTNIEFTRDMGKERTGLLSKPEGVLVVDEADYLGSKNSKQALGTKQIDAGFKLLLTATPFKRVSQIGRLLAFLNPGDFGFKSAQAFARAFPSESPEALKALFLLMQQHTIRIRKGDVFDEYDPSVPLSRQRDRLPKKVEITPEKQGRFYLTKTQCRSILELFTDYQGWCRKHKGHETDEDKEYKRYKQGFFSIKEALRQIMNDPAYISRPDIESPKHKKMDEIVTKELDGRENKGRKMIVFCRYVAEVEAYLERYKAYGARGYYGGLKPNSLGYKIDEKSSALYYKVDEYGKFILGEDGRPVPSDEENGRPIRALDYERICFQNCPEDRILFSTYEAGALGVTLTAADVVVDDDLAPTYRDQYQADDRAHRIDNARKKYNVTYYRLQAVYPKDFLDELDPETKETYFDMGTFDQVHFENIRRQRLIFHRIMDGVGDPGELTEAAKGFMRSRMPFMFEKGADEGEEDEETEEVEDAGNGDADVAPTPKPAKGLDAQRKTRRSALAPASKFEKPPAQGQVGASFEENLAIAANSIVRLSKIGGGKEWNIGTGWIGWEDGQPVIITAQHVIKDNNFIRRICLEQYGTGIATDREIEVDISEVYPSWGHDLIKLKVRPIGNKAIGKRVRKIFQHAPRIALLDPLELSPGEDVFIIGCPLNPNDNRRIYKGAFIGSDNDSVYVQPEVQPGFSGGGIFRINDKEVKLIGFVRGLVKKEGNIVTGAASHVLSRQRRQIPEETSGRFEAYGEVNSNEKIDTNKLTMRGGRVFCEVEKGQVVVCTNVKPTDVIGIPDFSDKTAICAIGTKGGKICMLFANLSSPEDHYAAQIAEKIRSLKLKNLEILTLCKEEELNKMKTLVQRHLKPLIAPDMVNVFWTEDNRKERIAITATSKFVRLLSHFENPANPAKPMSTGDVAWEKQRAPVKALKEGRALATSLLAPASQFSKQTKPALTTKIVQAELSDLDEALEVHNMMWWEKRGNEHLKFTREQMKRLIEQKMIYLLKVKGVDKPTKGVLCTYRLKTGGDKSKFKEHPLWNNMVNGIIEDDEPDTVLFWAITAIEGKGNINFADIFLEKAKIFFGEKYSYVATCSPANEEKLSAFQKMLRKKEVSENIIQHRSIYLYLLSFRRYGYEKFFEGIYGGGSFVSLRDFFREQKEEKIEDWAADLHIRRGGAIIAAVLPYKVGYTRPDGPYTVFYGYKGFEDDSGFEKLRVIILRFIEKGLWPRGVGLIDKLTEEAERELRKEGRISGEAWPKGKIHEIAKWFWIYRFEFSDRYLLETIKDCCTREADTLPGILETIPEKRKSLMEAISSAVSADQKEITIKSLGVKGGASDLIETAKMIMSCSEIYKKEVRIKLIGYDTSGGNLSRAKEALGAFAGLVAEPWKGRITYELYYGDAADERYRKLMCPEKSPDIIIAPDISSQPPAKPAVPAVSITPIGTVPCGDSPLRTSNLSPGSRFNSQNRILPVVTIGSLEFKVYVIREKNGIQRIEFHRVGRFRLPGTIPDMLAYSRLIPGDEKNQGLCGVFITEELRDQKLLRPLLNTFFAVFPDVRRTYPNMMNPVALALLNKEYGFAPASDAKPNAYVGHNGKIGRIYFTNEEARHLFLSEGGSGLTSSVMSDYEIVEHNFEGSAPLYLGQSLSAQDEAKFNVAKARFRWLIQPELLRALRENLLLSQARTARFEVLATGPIRASN